MNPWVRARDFLRPIHRAPVDWRDAWIHHGFRAFLVLVVAICVPLLFPRTTLPEFDGLTVGTVADRDVIAEISFSVDKTEEELQAERDATSRAVPIILAKVPENADLAIRRARALFAALDSTINELEADAAQDGGDIQAQRTSILTGLGEFANANQIPFLTTEQLEILLDDTERRRIRDAIEEAFDGPLRRGVARGQALSDAAMRRVVLRDEDRDRPQLADTIPTMEAFLRDQSAAVTGELPQEAVSLFGALVVQFGEPTLVRDTQAMFEYGEQLLAAVNAAADRVQQGERFITQYETIGERDVRRLESYQAALVAQGIATPGAAFLRSLGMVLLAASVLGLLVYTTFSFRREIYEDPRSFSVLLLLVFFVLGVSGVIHSVEWPPALIPVAFAALLVAGLFDAFLAIVVVCAIAGILLGQENFSGLAVPMLTAAAGVTAAFAVREVRRRSQSWVLIALITGSYFLTGLCLKLIGVFSWTEWLVAGSVGFGNAAICTALAMGAVLPGLELFTRRTTEQTLLELADMNRPLLRRLAREAPGTYSHSINMANLVESACDAIGANSLLARVGVYYHDIGKLTRPQYFIENQPKGLNPHDRLLPSQSAEILRAHVRDGLVLADEAGLPRVVKDFIREHHGTMRIEFFFAKAEQEQPGQATDPADFCYPGPKPQTKETAVALLADAVEAASRTLAEPSPEKIRTLIQTLTDARVSGGQFDECGLTFRDLDRVKREFARVLTGLYHHRIDYPQPAPRPAIAEGDGDAISEEDDREPAAGSKVLPQPALEPPAGEQMSIDLNEPARSDVFPG